MAKNYCTFIPSKGAELFKSLRNNLGYETARSVFLKAINPRFISDYKNTLRLDSEGIPTYESLMTNSYMKKFIGDTKIINAVKKLFKAAEDTLDNYLSALEQAYNFNLESLYKDDYTAIVEKNTEGKLIVNVFPKTDKTVLRFRDLYATNNLNKRLVEIFKPLGLTYGILTLNEVNAGRVGVTDFSKAKDIAHGFSSLIRVANNKEGAEALSEEFSHTIIGMFRNDPLVDRSINYLSQNEESLKQILGDTYEDTLDFYNGNKELVAEEALGHILKDSLIKETLSEKTPKVSLFKRVIQYIKNKFKGFNNTEVDNAVTSAETAMSALAKNIVDGTKLITVDLISSINRDVQFNALSDIVDRNINILKDAAKVEVKKSKILKNANKLYFADTVDDLLKHANEKADTALGIFNYAEVTLNELRSLFAQFQLFDSMPTDLKFGFLRSVRMFTLSYGGFITALKNAYLDKDLDPADDLFKRLFDLGGNITTDLGRLFNEIDRLSSMLNEQFMRKAKPAFTEFLKPFFGEDFVIPYGKDAGKKITIETLIELADRDISFTDRWLDSMADSSDLLLQLFDSVVKKAKDEARLKTLDDVRRILKLMLKAESYGIKDFEWMFEKDNKGNKSGNYISGINYAQFESDLKLLDKQLDELYGVNPKGQDAVDKINKRKSWLSTHAKSLFGVPKPDPIKYRNDKYFNLTDHQEEILNEFLDIKRSFDNKLPLSRVDLYKAIQMRKSGSNRMLESMSSPSKIFENIKESVSSALLDLADDDLIFGNNLAKKGLTDFSGAPFLTLPVLYTNRIANPNEITTDVFASLMSYAFMANNYEAMDAIVDPLEIGKIVTIENRKVAETRGNKSLIEKVEGLGVTAINKAFKNSGSFILDKLNDFMEAQVYGIHMKDAGTFEMFGKLVNINKVVNLVLKGSSLALLGFNFLALTANMHTGVAMQNIEAAAGLFFNRTELHKADKEYAAAMKDFGMELGKRVKTSKLHLFDELFNVKLDFSTRIKHNEMKSILQKIFGENVAFLGLDAGDHWLYNRTAIAMALRERVLLDGREMSLWEALKVLNTFLGENSIKELNYKQIKNLDGTEFDVSTFSRKVAHVNLYLFGIYNDEDMAAASRVVGGQLIMQYRKWIKPAMNKRFQAGQVNLATMTYEEGYYRTLLRFCNELVRGKFLIASQWGSLKDEEKLNINRALTELVQFFAVWALANLVEWPDDKKRTWYLKYLEYSVKRTAHELGGLTPSTVFLLENLKTLKTPIASLSAIQSLVSLASSAIDPRDWVDEILTGPYKGMSTIEKNFIKAPIPIVALWRQIDKFANDIDTSIQYYVRPY